MSGSSPDSSSSEPETKKDSTGRTTLKAGTIVAVRRGSTGAVDLARVTDASSSGTTVDIELLQPFVSELYIPSGKTSYARAGDVRQVAAEYAASQSGWIVLDADVREAEMHFKAQDPDENRDNASVVVQSEQRQLTDEMLQRQSFRPSRMQAFAGAAFSIPLAVIFYKSFEAVRSTYANNPVGDDFMSGELFRTILQVALGASVAGSIVVGAGLLLYALSMTEDDSNAK